MTPSLHNASSPTRRHAQIALWLVLCLMFAQWLGYAHSITHADAKAEPLISQSAQSGPSIASFDHLAASNACAAFDAATLGASLHSPAFVPLLAVLADAIESTSQPASWLRHFIALFSSRAPPHHH